MSLSLRFAARSDVGLLRVDRKNQDSVYAGPRLIAVADGVGGQAAGDTASRTVIQSLMHLDDDEPGSNLTDILRTAVRQANHELKAAIEVNSELDSMGTTLTALLFGGNKLGLVHVGDSRGYLFRDDELSQITADHTFVQSLVDEGRISAEEASVHPQRNIILKALSGADDVDPDFSVREAVGGDRYLLCSDGLSNVVSSDSIADALRTVDPDATCQRLIDLALRGGGPDNITVLVADIVDGPTGDDEPVVAGAAAEGRGGRGAVRPDTAAGRAALARSAGRGEEDDEPAATDEEPHSHRLRWTLVSLLIIVIVVAVGWGGWRYVQSQYYVGFDNQGNVSVLRGVSGTVAGVSLSSVAETTNLNRDDLQPVARNRVREGISAASRSDAARIVSELHSQVLPLCRTSGSTGTTTSTSPTPTPTPTPRASASRRTSRSPSARTTSTSPSPTPTPSPSQVPGQDCRTAH